MCGSHSGRGIAIPGDAGRGHRPDRCAVRIPGPVRGYSPIVGIGHADDIRKRWGAPLPHWTRDHAAYAVTFRLAGSLPPSVLARWRAEREHIVRRAAAMNRPLSAQELSRLAYLYSDRVEAYLDTGHGACWLRNPRIAALVRDALLHFDGDRYVMHAWCVMPNHVRAAFSLEQGDLLPVVLHSWKTFTATAANRLLGRTGPFWQREHYDHLIRDGDDFAHAVNDVLANPPKAGLRDWPRVGSRGQPNGPAGAAIKARPHPP